MTRSTRTRRSRASIAAAIALALAAGAAASGCEIIASFDRTKIDAGGLEEDAAAYDAPYPSEDGSPGADSSVPAEASANDAPNDTSPLDGGGNTSDGDANVPDSHVTDTGTDTGTDSGPDTSVADTGTDADDDSGD